MPRKKFIQSEPEPIPVRETLIIKPKFQIGDSVWFLDIDTLKIVSKQISGIHTTSTGHGWDVPITNIEYTVVEEGALDSWRPSKEKIKSENLLFATKEDLINSL